VDSSALHAAFQFLEQRRDEQWRTLQRWCQQNSGSRHLAGLQAMANMLEGDFAVLQASLQRCALPEYQLLNDFGVKQSHTTGDLLCWDHCPEAQHRLLLMIHYDTVYAPLVPPGQSGAGAEGELPYQVSALPESNLRAPGAADAKGGLLVMREALLALRRFNLDAGIGWSAWANPDEEIGSPASSDLMRSQAAKFDFGLLFEPSLPDGALVAARKGSGNFTLIVHGRSAHAGRDPGQGRNAIVHLAKLLVAIDSLNQSCSPTTINVGRIAGGEALNRVPDRAVGKFNVRILDQPAGEFLVSRLQQLVGDFSSDGFTVELHGEFTSPPKPVNAAQQQLQRRVEQAKSLVGKSVQWRDTGGACDGSKWSAFGLPNIDSLGPTGDCLHSPEEWVDFDSILPAAQTVVALIAQYAAEVRAEKGSGAFFTK
jgi:glutamate carboxypeptidase